MATKKINHTITINGKKYTQPKARVDAYMHYLEVRDSIMDTEGKSGLYTAKQFREMIDCVVEMYGNQFTKEELTAADGGLSVGEIITEFAAIEIGVGQAVNDNVEKMQANFQNGK